MTTIDRDLAGALKLALTKPMNFALVIKAPGEGTLIVSKKPIPIGAIAQAKRELGGGQIVKGRCTGGPSGQLVFETAKEPAPNVAKTIKAVIKRDAGLTLNVETKQAPDLADDEDEAKTDPAYGKPKTDPADAKAKTDLAKRLAVLSDRYKVATNSDDADSKRLKQQLETVKTLIAKQDYAAATNALDVLEHLLDALPTDKDLAEQARQRGFADGESGRGRRGGKLVGTDLEDYLDHYDAGLEAGKKARVKKQLADRKITGAVASEEELQAAYDLGFKEGDGHKDARSRPKFTKNPALLASYDTGYHDGEMKRWKRTGEAAPDPD